MDEFGGITPIAAIVALIGVGGAGAFIRDAIDGILKLRGGMAAKESKRRFDIIQQRDDALERAAAAEARIDIEVRNRGRTTEYAQALRVHLIELGVSRDALEGWPLLEETIIPASELRRIKAALNLDTRPNQEKP